jgi:asparagine synthase (glutamine-hydrolysing)
VAHILGTDHQALYVTGSDALGVVPDLASLYDEPFADSSQIPTYLLSKLTRRYVTVALSGDGGDELFGGYVRYLRARSLLRLFSVAPLSVRRRMAAVLRGLAGPRWNRLIAVGPRRFGSTLSSDRLKKLSEVVNAESCREMYGRLTLLWQDPRTIARGLPLWPAVLDDDNLRESFQEPLSWMMHIDQMTYLPDDILVKVDRASMAVALEARVPLLDHRVVEFAASLPLSLKIRGGQGKWALRQILYRYVNRNVVDRPKQGFAVPLNTWLRGPLRDWAEDLLSESALLRSGVFDSDAIRRCWSAHLTGTASEGHRLWAVLMLQSWLRSQVI